MQTGWLQSGGYWYYLDENGAMLTDTTRTIDGKACRFDASGRWQP
jgi:glucan-binding YG repeat protein